MSAVDLILNLVGLVLWLNWRASAARPSAAAAAPGSHRPAPGPSGRQLFYLAALLLLVAGRALFYWQAGPPVDWIARIPLGLTTLSFSSAVPARIALYSALSFGATLGLFYLCLLLLSWVAGRTGEGETGRRLIRERLGRIDRWPGAAKLLLPLLVMAAFWCALHPALARLGVTPASASAWQLIAQGAVLGLGVHFFLKFLLIGLLALHLINSHVYLGEFPAWQFVNAAARELLRPVRWLPLRVGKIDFAPALGMALVFLASEFGQRELTRLYEKLI